MPLLVLLLVALAAGSLMAYASLRYPTPIATSPTQTTAEHVVEVELERHPWLLRLVRERLDPATATGLALTVALAVVIVGGVLVGALAYLMRSSDRLVDSDRAVGEWGVDHATSWSTEALELATELGSSTYVIPAMIVLTLVEYWRVPNRWMPVFLTMVVLGEILVVNTVKELLDRVRPEFNPIAETLGPSFPSGHSGLAAAFYAGAALVLTRRRSPRTRALLAGGAVAIAASVACSRVLLGVHWMSDVLAGLALGWAWFGICAIAFGGRILVLGAPVEHAAEIAEQHVPVAERPKASAGQTS